jgi:hypothetical protein
MASRPLPLPLPWSEAKPGHRSATIGTQPSKILDPEQRGRCRFKGQPRQVYEPLGDSCRGCDLLAGQREYALRFWPASFHTALEYARNTSTKCVNLSEGARQSAGSFTVWQSKSDLARSGEAGEAVSIHDCRTLRFFELARVLVRLNHVARFVINANHSAM